MGGAGSWRWEGGGGLLGIDRGWEAGEVGWGGGGANRLKEV